MKYLSEEDEQWVAEDLANCLPSEPPVRFSELVVPPAVEHELTKFIRVELPCGATATVSKDISAKGLAALDEMMRTAMKAVASRRHNESSSPTAADGNGGAERKH